MLSYCRASFLYPFFKFSTKRLAVLVKDHDMSLTQTTSLFGILAKTHQQAVVEILHYCKSCKSTSEKRLFVADSDSATVKEIDDSKHQMFTGEKQRNTKKKTMYVHRSQTQESWHTLQVSFV